MDIKMLDLYSDFLICNTHYATATGLANILEGIVSHDQVTRFLSKQDFTSQDLWQLVKPIVKKIKKDDGAIIFDDTVEEKEYTDENDIICWHYSHAQGRIVKGINILSAMVVYDEVSLPVAFDIIKKEIRYSELKTKLEKRKSAKTKNQLLRDQYKICLRNLPFKYVLTDIWFCSNENLEMIDDSKKIFICGTKSNRTVALSWEDKRQGKFTKISTLTMKNSEAIPVYFQGLSIPLLLVKKIFKNKDGSEGVLYLVTNEKGKSGDEIYEIYKRRWKIEEYHKSIKSNTSLKKSPTRTVRTQTNHVFASIYGFVKLEKMKMATKINHFALKYKIILKASMAAFRELSIMRDSMKIA